MKITSIKTHKITPEDKLFDVLDKYVQPFPDGSILAVTSKIVSITEGRVVEIAGADKDKLIEEESELYLPREENPYHVSLTVTRGTLAASAGIDESNAGEYYVLWPQDAFFSANQIREYLKKKFNLRNVGVIITDSRTTPMRWGVTSMAIGYSGFVPLKDYIGKPDIYGRPFQFEKLSIVDSLATAASVVMGEGNEQTPLAVIEDLPFVEFMDRDLTEDEISELRISLDEDLYSEFLKNAPWRKGKAGKK